MPRVYQPRDLVCRKLPNGYAIAIAGQPEQLVRIIPDVLFPGLWCLIEPSGRPSMGVPFGHAKNVALTRAIGILNDVRSLRRRDVFDDVNISEIGRILDRISPREGRS